MIMFSKINIFAILLRCYAWVCQNTSTGILKSVCSLYVMKVVNPGKFMKPF